MSTTKSTIWDWIQDLGRQAHTDRDAERYHMVRLFFDAMQIMSADPKQSQILLTKSRREAVLLAHDWFILLCDHWLCQIALNKIPDFERARSIAEAAIREVASPKYDGLPQRVCLFDDLVGVYQSVDPHGYAAEIEDACAQMERNNPDPYSCAHCLRTIRIDSDLDGGRLEEAKLGAIAGLKAPERTDHYTPVYYLRLCHIAFAESDFAKMAHWSSAGHVFHGRMGQDKTNIELMMWSALAHVYLGDLSKARNSYRASRFAAKALGRDMSSRYYDALAEYQKALGREKLALIARDQQLPTLGGAAHLECQCRLDRLRLMVSLGRSVDEELTALHTTAKRLRDPKPVLDAAAEIVGLALTPRPPLPELGEGAGG
jgi:hypothetical protein